MVPSLVTGNNSNHWRRQSGLAPGPHLSEPGRMVRLVVDTDPGVDDAHAILLAFAHPGARVEAITTVAGNVALPLTTANAATILDILDVSPERTPIFAGADRALL